MPAGLPELDVARAQRWCASRVPAELHNELVVECDVAADHLTIVECRPPWRGHGDWTRSRVAQLRYTPLTGLWTLYYCDQRDRFQLYPDAAPRRTLERLLDEIDADPTGIFWG